MTQNVPFIVAQHLNTVKHNTSAIRGLAQLASSSSRVGRSFPNNDKRYRRYVKATFVDWLERFLRKRNRRKFVESDYVSIPGIRNDTDETIYVSWSLEDMINQDLFVDYFTWYANHGFPQKQDFTAGHIHIYDPLNGFEWVMERMRQAMFVVIPYRNMRSLMPKTLPTSQTGWTKLAKAVYTRSRTRGSIDPVASTIVIDALIDYYLIMQQNSAAHDTIS